MKVAIGLLALALQLGHPPEVVRSHISGKVEILDKGDVRRKVIQDVLIYVDGVKAPIPETLRSAKVKITSKEKSFVPHVEAVPVGAPVTFPNLDDIMHNVFSISRGNRFDLGLYKSGASKVRRFEKPGLVRIYCNIHPQMSALLVVTDNPYFTWAEPDGAFRLDGLPPGTYTVKAWHEQAQAAKKVVVGEGGAGGVEFLLDARRFKKKSHLNKFGKPYKKKKY